MLARLLAPARCAGCDAGRWPLCASCRVSLAVVFPPLCGRCGRPTEEQLTSCADCPPPGIDTVRAPFLYEGAIARAIKGVKFSGWRALAPHLAGAMDEVRDSPSALVTWVPLAPGRRARRGFDQAESLARALAARAGLRARRLLVRTEETPAQSRLSGRSRRHLEAGAFVSIGAVPRDVLLVDDVLTTGATAAACAAALRRAGAERVDVLVAARALRAPDRPVPARCRAAPAGAV